MPALARIADLAAEFAACSGYARFQAKRSSNTAAHDSIGVALLRDRGPWRQFLGVVVRR